MAVLFGKEFTRRQLMSRIGDISQLAGTRSYELNSGKAKGVGAVDIRTGAGLEYTILPSRGMDIAWASFREYSIAYMSKTGVVAPEYFVENGARGFLDNFFAGLLTTGGLTHFGSPCTDDGEALGLHGLSSNLPSEDVSILNEWDGDDYIMKVRGRVRQSSTGGAHIVRTREISSKLGENKLLITDTIENEGFQQQPFMLLYHVNFGFPVVSENTELIMPPAVTMPRTEEASKGIGSFKSFQAPTHNYSEQCFYHDITPNAEGWAYAGLFNPGLGANGLGAYVKYKKSQLPNLVEWKQMGEQEYVVGLEPGTWYCEGRAEARKRGELQYINPGEVKSFEVEIGIAEGRQAFASL